MNVRIFEQNIKDQVLEYFRKDQIFLAYDLPRQIVIDVMILYKNMKTMFRSPHGNTHFARILTRDTVSPFPFIIFLDYAYDRQ